MADLTIKQQKFVDLYLETGNATKSYLGSGFKAKNDEVAASLASRLLRNDKVHAYITAERNRLKAQGKLNRDDLLAKNAEIAFSNLDDVVEIDERGKPRLKAGASLNGLDTISANESSSSEGSSSSFSVKRSDRLKALDAVAKLIGAYDNDEGDSGRDLKNSAARILEALGRVRPK